MTGDELIVGHMGLVVDIVRKLVGRTDPELVAAGNLGLVLAARRFDPARGVAFSTFAYKRVRGCVLDAMHQRRDGVLEVDVVAPSVDEDTAIVVRGIIDQLPARSARVARALAAGQTGASIAVELGVCEQRVSQLIHEMRPRFRKAA